MSAWVDFVGSVLRGVTNFGYGESLIQRLLSSSTSLVMFNSNSIFREVLNFTNISNFRRYFTSATSSTDAQVELHRSSEYASVGFSSNSSSSNLKHALNESTNDQRFMRNMNPVFKYDFKVGNYMPDDLKKMNPHLFMTIKDVTTGIRKSA